MTGEFMERRVVGSQRAEVWDQRADEEITEFDLETKEDCNDE